MSYEFTFHSVGELADILKKHDVYDAIIKPLSKNHNDKNQVYSGSDFKPLTPFFKVSFQERTTCVSTKKAGVLKGSSILEAIFDDFFWLTCSGQKMRARNVKMIIYPQYPEARLSGFQAIDGTMPKSMSVEFTKNNPDSIRYLVLGRHKQGEVIAMMVLDPSPIFVEELKDLPGAEKSRVWKYLKLDSTSRDRLKALLIKAASTNHRGCRLDRDGNVIPFNGTQVCGYTLEQVCGILPNSDKSGDYEGIELKAHTQKKVTLFTPEPDMGEYARDFNGFMKTFGYLDAQGNYRLTGIHKAGTISKKSGLRMSIENYNPEISVVAQHDIYVALFDQENRLAAGWSLERLLNCWGAKHNEVVYVPASRSIASNEKDKQEGYKYRVSFGRQVLWCQKTSIDKLFQAIYDGIIFLDPAPKLHMTDKRQSKRRSQWRVNDINEAAQHLYEDIRCISL